MVKWLTAEWFDEAVALAEEQPRHPGASARVQCVVTGGPDGDVTYHAVVEDGRVVASAPGALPDAEVTLTANREDARHIQTGELAPSVAFMQGRLKVSGSMAALLALLPATTTPDYEAYRSRLAGVTEF